MGDNFCELSSQEPIEPAGDEAAELSARETLDRLIQNSGEGYAAISRLLGRNPAYVQQYVKRGIPRRLSEEDRRRLAQYFRVSEEVLGGLPAPTQRISPDSTCHDLVEIRHAQKPAGERPRIIIDRSVLQGLSRAQESWLVAHRVDDDSMAPTIGSGDLVLIDTADQRERLRDGIYAIENESRIFIKRLAINPVTLRVVILSDNAVYTSVAECEQSQIEVVGRVVWHGRTI